MADKSSIGGVVVDLGLSGNVAIVSGASRGIGKAIALALAAEGCHLAICARGREELDQAAEAIRAHGVEALPVIADMTSPSDPERLIAETITAFGKLDVLVVSAGGSPATPVERAADGEWLEGFERNVLHVARLARAAIPHLRDRQGRIVIVASIWGREAGGSPIYNAVKAAEISLTKSLARELAPDGIGVNAICPGSTLFPGGSWARRVAADPEAMANFVRQEIPMGRFGTPEEVAAAAVFLASPRASWITGVALPVDGGQSRAF